VKPLVVIGAARSGTNLLRELVCQAPGFATWPCDEINLLWRHGNARHPDDELAPTLATPAVARYMRRRFSDIARRSHAAIVVEKTCANSLRVGFVDRILPDARYLFILRDGRDAAASAMHRFKSALDPAYTLKKLRYLPLPDLPLYAAQFAHNRITRVLRRDRRLWEALDAFPGLRILRQDPWECTAAFITSIASNIPRITGNLNDMAREYGSPIRLGSAEDHTFPRPDHLDDELGLRRLKLGFRAGYLVQAARLARSGILEEIACQSYEDAKETLMVIPGVAEKVADCVLLFAYGRLNAFPVDTWIRKVMIQLFFKGRRVPDRAIRAFASERWGDLAGVAQQYLYHWSRRSGLFSARASASRPEPVRR